MGGRDLTWYLSEHTSKLFSNFILSSRLLELRSRKVPLYLYERIVMSQHQYECVAADHHLQELSSLTRMLA